MAKTVVLHLDGEEPILADIEQDPLPSDMFLKVSNLRKRDGKDVPYIAAGVQSVGSRSSKLCQAPRNAAM